MYPSASDRLGVGFDTEDDDEEEEEELLFTVVRRFLIPFFFGRSKSSSSSPRYSSNFMHRSTSLLPVSAAVRNSCVMPASKIVVSANEVASFSNLSSIVPRSDRSDWPRALVGKKDGPLPLALTGELRGDDIGDGGGSPSRGKGEWLPELLLFSIDQ